MNGMLDSVSMRGFPFYMSRTALADHEDFINSIIPNQAMLKLKGLL
jgi:hypothetical protein